MNADASSAGRSVAPDLDLAALHPALAGAPGGRARTPSGDPFPGVRDTGFWAVLALAFALLLLSWSQIAGYQLADSVEYMERAQAIVRGEELIDSQAIRSFGFSGLLLPLFAAADLLGMEDLRPVVWSARLMQILLGVVLVATTVRIGARLGGRSMGLAAGALLAANPVFLRWSVSPTSDIAGALGVALAVSILLDRGSTRRAFVGGLFLGASFLMTYKIILIVGLIGIWILLRELRSGRRVITAVLAGAGCMILLQCFLDWLYYGSFGVSLLQYLRENVGVILTTVMYRAGFEESAEWLYNNVFFTEAAPSEEYQDTVGVIHQKRGLGWYFANLTTILPWPAIVLIVPGLLAVLGRSKRRWGLVLFTVLGYVFVLTFKGSKEFRLWTAILPLLCVLVAHGWCWLGGFGRKPPPGCVRRSLALFLLVLACVHGVRALSASNRRHYGAFWEAMEIVNRAAADSVEERAEQARGEGLEEPPARLRVSCAYHWAVFLQESSDVELIKLPHHLDHWKRYGEDQRAADLEAIAGLDWFITHLPVLTDHPELMEAINSDFQVHTALYDRETFETLGPIYVLRKRTGEATDRTFYDLDEEGDPAVHAARHDLGEPLFFGRFEEDGIRSRLVLLGWEYQPLPHPPRSSAGGHGWITYHWWGGPFDGADYHLLDRITSLDQRNAWHNNHEPAYGMHPTSTWGSGWLMRESYLVVGEADAFDPTVPLRPVGGAYRRGDLIPASLWFRVVEYGEAPEEGAPPEIARLLPYRLADGVPLQQISPPGAFYSPQGHRTSKDGMALVGRFFLPVREEYVLPDDGRPVPLDG